MILFSNIFPVLVFSMLMVIDWSFCLTVVGTIATVVFGIWAILLAKQRAYPGQMTYYAEPAIRLFHDITRNLPQITVSYKGQPAQKNLTVLRGYLVNTGSKDLTKEMVEKPLTIELADGYRWLEVSAKSAVNSEERAKIINPKTIEVELGLFRRDEFLRLDGLIEFQEGKRWAGAICFEHRIADTGDVRWQQLPNKVKEPLKDIGFWAAVVLLLFLCMAGWYNISKIDWSKDSGLWIAKLVFALISLMFPGSIIIAFFVNYWSSRKIRSILHLEPE
jgi:hypothetical protein